MTMFLTFLCDFSRKGRTSFKSSEIDRRFNYSKLHKQLSLQDEGYGYHVKSALRNSDILLLFWEHIISLFENSDTIDVDM